MMKNNIFFIDLLRVVATLAVIILHVSALNFTDVSVFSNDWNYMNIWDSAVRWCVPIFIMISGRLWLDETITPMDKISKAIYRIIIAFVVWSALYILLINKGVLSSFESFIRAFIKGHYHLWFLPMIVGLYMFIPIGRKVVSSNKLLKYFVCVSLLFTFIVPFLIMCINYISPLGSSIINMINKSLNIHFAFGYISLFVFGYYLDKIEISKTVQRCLMLLGILCVVCTAVFTLILSRIKGEPDTILYGYLQLNTLLTSTGVFLLIKNLCKDKYVNWIHNISKHCFGVYLVHVLVIWFVYYVVHLRPTSFLPLFAIPVISILVFVASMFISMGIKKIPYIGKYIV